MVVNTRVPLILHSQRDSALLRGRRAVGILFATIIGLAMGCGSADETADETTNAPGPLLEPSEPLRRLGESEFRLTSNSGNRRSFRFSPDGKLLAAANWDEVRLWSFPDGKLLHDFSDTIDSNCIAFANDGTEFLALDQRQMAIHRFDVNTGKRIDKTKLADVVKEKGATTYTMSDDGRWLCTTEVYGNVTVWDTSTGKRQLRMQPERVGASRGGSISKKGVLTLCDGTFLGRYDVTTGKLLSHSRLYQRLLSPIGNAEGTLFAAYSTKDRAIVFWDPERNRLVGGEIPSGQREWRPEEAALSADGRRFVYWINPGTYVFDKKIAVFDVETGQPICEFDPPGIYFVEQPVVSPDGGYTFPAGSRSVFCPFDAKTGKPVRDTPDHILAVDTFSFTPNGQTLIVGSMDKRQAWDVKTGQPGTVFESWYHTLYVASVDNRRALVSGLRHGGLRLHAIDSGAVERHFEKDSNKHLSALQLGTDRESFVGIVGGREGAVVRRWDIDTGKVLAEWNMPPQTRESDYFGRYAYRGLALGGSRLIRFEQIRPPKKLPDGSIDWGHTNLLLEDWTTQTVTNRLRLPAYSHFSVADAKDGRTMAAVVSDDSYPSKPRGTIWGATYILLWDAATGWERLRLTRQMTDYFSAFANITITPDVRLAATSSHRNRIEVWNIFTGELLQRFDAANDITELAFADDGAILASGHPDGSVYLWDTRPAWQQAVPRRSVGWSEAQQFWNNLAEEGRAPALAMQHLLGDPDRAVELLKQNLQPAAPATDVPRLIADLSAAEPPASDAAETELRQLGPRAVDALNEALEKNPNEDVAARIEQLIDAAANPLPAELRRKVLAVELAERLDTVESRELLERIAAGAPDAVETKTAIAALQRVRMRDAMGDGEMK